MYCGKHVFLRSTRCCCSGATRYGAHFVINILHQSVGTNGSISANTVGVSLLKAIVWMNISVLIMIRIYIYIFVVPVIIVNHIVFVSINGEEFDRAISRSTIQSHRDRRNCVFEGVIQCSVSYMVHGKADEQGIAEWS